jgi:biopolymer transport protein ExbD/biopolymer transport protein TolR
MGAAIPAASKKRRDEAAPNINITPLVDVVLVLLIIFMVIAPALEHGERVELPGVFFPDKIQKGKLDPITLTVGRGGTVYYEKTPVPLADLPARLAVAHQAEPDRRVVLKGDGMVEYQKIRDVFLVAQNAGFSGIALQVSKRGTGQEPAEESD